ncbi:MAG: AarF/ABC1/UbiB kinase family protein, partial [Candidatus Obscuribacterales bacterium]|nr:AarF/ABC1/UbiB kinase family protein [Candidatus Obscuribacterales bacterium]
DGARGLTILQKRQRKAGRIRETLIDLGPTFVKLGQFLSVRRDILPPEMADELAKLQDKVPPFDIATVKATIERDLGRMPDKIFARFEEEPVASASIGQVHRAWLKDGTQVVVKVQRPKLASRFYQDLGYMRLVTRLGSVLRPSGEWENWQKLSDEFGKTIFSEINYLQEGKNADRLRHLLKDHEDVRIPRVFWKYTGRRVLTLEYIPGIKVDKVDELRESGLDLVAIGNRLVSCYLDQVLLHGFFHADPHAGNLAIDHHGNIVIYDFGMIGRISETQRNAITGCIASVIKTDLDELIEHLTALEIVKKDASAEPLKRALKPFIAYYAGKGIRDLDFGNVEGDIDEIANERAIRMPPTLAYLLRTGSSLEGIARTLHPNFSFVEAAKPSLKKWILNRPDQAAQVLKLMASGNQLSIKAVWQRLIKTAIGSNNSLTFLDLDSTNQATGEDVRTVKN